jgi:hypothetical protein
VWRRARIGIVVSALLVASAHPSRADDKAACVDAASRGQVLRDQHKLVEARDAFRVCAGLECPAMVQKDCSGWLDAVEAGVPSIVISAKDAMGVDLVNVRVSIDGTPTLTSLDGQSMTIDPGTHTFHFELPDGTALDQQVVVAEGAKNKQVSVVLGRSSAPLASTIPLSLATEAPPPGPSSWKTLGWVAGGVGLGGLVLGTAFGIVAISDKSSANCVASVCDAGPLSRARTAATVSTVGFVAGGALAVTGLGILIFAPRRRTSEAVVVRAAPVAGAARVGLVIDARF